MNKILMLLVAGLMIVYNLSAKSYENAVISDLTYTLIPNEKENFDSISFPFYFNSEKFEQKICETIERMIYNKYNITKVQYPFGKEVTYCQKEKPDKLRLKKAVDRSNKNAIYVALETSLHTTGWRYRTGTIYPRCFITTKITILDNHKMKIYEYAREQPFDIYIEDEITGLVMIGELDFQEIFIQNIKEVFYNRFKEKKYVATEVTMVKKPVPLKYFEILSNSTRYEVTIPNNAILFSDEYNEGFGVIELHFGTWRKYSVNDIRRLFPKYSISFYRSSYSFDNFILNETYDVYKLDNDDVRIDGPGTRPTLKYLPDKVKLRIDTGWFKEIGEFTYHPLGKLSGELKHIECGAEWICENNIIEIYRTNSLLGLFQIFPDKRYIYFPNDLTDEDVGLLINLMHLFEYSVFLQEITDVAPKRD